MTEKRILQLRRLRYDLMWQLLKLYIVAHKKYRYSKTVKDFHMNEYRLKNDYLKFKINQLDTKLKDTHYKRCLTYKKIRTTFNGCTVNIYNNQSYSG